jgi:TRAP-type transport system periplasmic protein
MTRRCLLAVLVTLLAAAPVAAQEVTWRLAHWLPPTHPLNRTGLVPWAQSIEQASGGSLKIQIFPAQQLGAAADHYDMARDGIASVTWVSPGYQTGRFPIMDAGGLPFVVANATGGSAGYHEWYAKYAPREMGDVKVCLAHVHAPATIHSKRPVRVPEDIRGLKVRPAHASMARFITLLGGSNVQLTAPESREALERGVADAITFPWGSLIRPWGIDKAVSHHLDLPLYVTPFVVPINKGAYEGLTPAQRQVVDAHCTAEWAEKISTGWAESEAKGYEELKGRATHTVYTPTAEEAQRWRQAAAPVYDAWVGRVSQLGLDGTAVLDELRAALRARGALADF